MSNKLAVIVLAIVLLFSVAFSTLLIVSLKEKSPDANVGNDTVTERPSETETAAETQTETETTAEKDPHRNDGLTKAPDFTVYDVSGNAVKLSDYLGKPVVLNFWATWCGQCMEEMPEFEEVYEQYNGEVVFLMVNSTDGFRETSEMAFNYIMSKKYNLPMFLDVDVDAVPKYGVGSLPHTFFINEDGYIVSNRNSKLSKASLISQIERIYTP